MKPKRVFSFLLVLFTFFLCAANVLAENVPIPTPSGDIYVQDFAHILNEAEKTELINLGRSIEDQTTAQVAVLTVPTIGNKTIDQFANEAFRQYGIGNKKENNGVLLVLAMKERKVRIEVGYGLEGRIPDGKAGRILDESATPYLKKQQPNRAVVETYKALTKEVLAEYGKGDVGKKTTQDKGVGIPTWLIFLGIAVLVVVDFIFFGGTLTRLLLFMFFRGGGGGGGGSGGSRGGGGGSSGGGGAGRGW
ncbi:YgcG family protein [Bacillus sp. EB600]|uniref:TPM domain-containing protein n=1 Tax=Bacillus sp. EB600 TaxID=2806345 RepID=UPI0021092BE1|nr:TPM domain-containing protein [Bacillus sp. EB600]MCQ6279260.1 TPM domain-containing protein [Bacillus sp. EB600]